MRAMAVISDFASGAGARIGGLIGKWRDLVVSRSGAPPSRRTITLLVAGAASVAVGVAALTAGILWDAHRLVWEHAVRSSQNLGVAFEQAIKRNIQIYDLSLQAAIEALKQPALWSMTPEERNLLLFDRAATAEHLGGMYVLDETGEIVFDSRSSVARRGNFGDRDFFAYLRGHRDAGLYISHPFFARFDRKWSIAIARRLEHPDGSFAGVVVGSLRLSFFQDMFDAVDPGEDSGIALARTDDWTLLVRKPFNESEIGMDLSGGSLSRHFVTATTGVYEDVSLVDGMARLFIYRKVGDLPLVVTVLLSEDAVFAEWRHKAFSAGLAVSGLTALAGLLGWRFLVELQRRSAAEQIARESESRYRLLADHATDLILRVGLDGERRYVSPASRIVYGFTPDELTRTNVFLYLHPEDRGNLQAAHDALLAGADTARASARVRRKDGSYVW
ncbi:MAG: PAS domain S-box protein, partial [Alphaproteobacteria bacterium]|nr:PAS domain S-box protein [Alphaproteobacteria bacterium]